MATFKPKLKAYVEFNGKKYKIDTGMDALSLAMFINVRKMDGLKDKVNLLQADYIATNITFDDYTVEVEKLFKAMNKESKDFIIRLLGERAFYEIEEAIDGFEFDDYNEMTNAIMEEIIKLRKYTNDDIAESVKARG